MELTKVEEEIIKLLRNLPAYSKIEITVDQTGKFDSYLIHKSQKIVLNPQNIK